MGGFPVVENNIQKEATFAHSNIGESTGGGRAFGGIVAPGTGRKGSTQTP